jgi:hypothetical protein
MALPTRSPTPSSFPSTPNAHPRIPPSRFSSLKLTQAKVFDEIGLGHVEVGLRRADLQRWMQDWHQKLRVCLEAEIADIIAAEAKQTRGMW